MRGFLFLCFYIICIIGLIGSYDEGKVDLLHAIMLALAYTYISIDLYLLGKNEN